MLNAGALTSARAIRAVAPGQWAVWLARLPNNALPRAWKPLAPIVIYKLLSRAQAGERGRAGRLGRAWQCRTHAAARAQPPGGGALAAGVRRAGHGVRCRARQGDRDHCGELCARQALACRPAPPPPATAPAPARAVHDHDVGQSCKIGACWRGLWCPRARAGQKTLPYAHSMLPVRSAPWRCTMPSCCPGRQYRALRRSRRPAQRARLRLHHSCPAGRRVLPRWRPRARCASPTLQSYDGRCHVRLLRKHRPGH